MSYLDEGTIRGRCKAYGRDGQEVLAGDVWQGSRSRMIGTQKFELCADRLVWSIGSAHPEYLAQGAPTWVETGLPPPAKSTDDRGRANVHGVLNLVILDARFVEQGRLDGTKATQLLAKPAARKPDKRLVHVIWDNAADHKGLDVRESLALPGCRIHLTQLPTLCPDLIPTEQLWDVMHQHVTGNCGFPIKKQFADAIMAFFGETVLTGWNAFRTRMSDNYRFKTRQRFSAIGSIGVL